MISHLVPTASPDYFMLAAGLARGKVWEGLTISPSSSKHLHCILLPSSLTRRISCHACQQKIPSLFPLIKAPFTALLLLQSHPSLPPTICHCCPTSTSGPHHPQTPSGPLHGLHANAQLVLNTRPVNKAPTSCNTLPARRATAVRQPIRASSYGEQPVRDIMLGELIENGRRSLIAWREMSLLGVLVHVLDEVGELPRESILEAGFRDVGFWQQVIVRNGN